MLFINNNNLLLQIKYILILTNNKNQTNIIYQLLIKYKKITKNILTLKLYAIIYRFNIKVLIKTTINKILNKNIFIILYINFKSLYNYFIKLKTI